MAIVYEHNFQGSIWKVVAGGGPYLGVEVRDEDSLEVTFSKVSLDDHSIERISHSELDWWVSLIGINESGSYYKKFESEKDPFQQAILHLDRTNTLKEQSNASQFDYDRQFLNPVVYTESDPYWRSTAKFLKRMEIDPTLSIEYVERENYFVIVYYEALEGRLRRALMIVSHLGNTLFKTILDDDSKGEAGQGFITYSNLVIFVSERKKLRFFEV